MNERIRELVLKAQTQAAKETIQNSFSYGAQGTVEKFAELIVRECVGRVRYCIQNDLDYIAEDIEQHLGVKE